MSGASITQRLWDVEKYKVAFPVDSVPPTSFRATHQSYPLIVESCLWYNPSYRVTESDPPGALLTARSIVVHISVGASVGEGVVGETLGERVGCLVSKHSIWILTILLS